ncbi:MAG: hypothetical protein ACR2IP_02965 [Solirubrobacteraceae bacterium]
MPARESRRPAGRPIPERLDPERAEGSGSGEIVADAPPAAGLGEGDAPSAAPRTGDGGPFQSSLAGGGEPPDREPTTVSARALRGRAQPRTAILVALAVCVALAALSAVLLPTVPSYDPWAWIVWGREVFDPHLGFATGGGPSWKPLPVIFTAVLGLFGGAAPTLWVITARAGGLLALAAAWRLGSRLARGPDLGAGGEGAVGLSVSGGQVPAARPSVARLAGPIAGLVAVLGVLLTQDYSYYMFRGASEPMLIATVLWAIDRLLDGRHAQAFVLAVGAGLIRPEAWPFLGLYALWLWFSEPRLRVLVLAGLAAIPLFWFVPTWIGSGQPFLAASHAKAYNGHLGGHPALEALRRSADLQVLPALIAAAVAVAFAFGKRVRDRRVLVLAAGALAWIALVVAMVLAGYPGLERFFLPASAIICVLAGVGVARVSVLAGRGLSRGSGGGLATLVVAGVLIAVSIPLSSSRIDTAVAQRAIADRAVATLSQLSAAVRAAGGHRKVFPCRSSFAAVNHAAQTALAWKLHVTLGRVGTSLRKPGVDFIGPHNSIDGAPAPVRSTLTGMALLAQTGVWRVVRVTLPGHSNACVGR